MDAHHIYAEDGSFDVVIANHMLFYCEDLEKVFSENSTCIEAWWKNDLQYLQQQAHAGGQQIGAGVR